MVKSKIPTKCGRLRGNRFTSLGGIDIFGYQNERPLRDIDTFRLEKPARREPSSTHPSLISAVTMTSTHMKPLVHLTVDLLSEILPEQRSRRGAESGCRGTGTGTGTGEGRRTERQQNSQISDQINQQLLFIITTTTTPCNAFKG